MKFRGHCLTACFTARTRAHRRDAVEGARLPDKKRSDMLTDRFFMTYKFFDGNFGSGFCLRIAVDLL